MIKTNTLFILGAGASKPYGYPTGNDLRHKILTMMDEDDIIDAYTKWYLQKYNNMIVSNSSKVFREKFEGSGDYSIDAFLEHRPEFMDIGKIYIARILISFEEDKRLRNIKDNWYMYLFDRIKISFEELGKNKISFITFNYDRSLEYFLFKAIQDKFSKESAEGAKECAEMMKKFPIVHLYGKLDHLPWQKKNGTEYSTTENLTNRLMAAPENIKLISNERDVEKSEYFQKAYKLIEEAERIFFLGFSFDKTNLDRLQVGFMGNKLIYATSKGLDPMTCAWINKYFDGKGCRNLTMENTDAMTLLGNRLEIE